jgi:hypothetical protein
MMREKLEALDRYNGIEKDPEGVYIMRDEALAILAADVDSDVDSLGDLPSSWPTNEEESVALNEKEKRSRETA